MTMDGLAPEDRTRIDRTFQALRARGVEPLYVTDRTEALSTVLARIPAGSSVAHGTSTSLIQIGFVDRMKATDSPYRYMNAEWIKENDAGKRFQLRAKLSLEADWYLGSVQAICETGEVVGADASGSRQAFYVFGPQHVIWVAGVNKLVPDLEAGLRRVREVALPLEDKRMKAAGAPGSSIGKLVVYEKERPGRITLILVGESLGF